MYNLTPGSKTIFPLGQRTEGPLQLVRVNPLFSSGDRALKIGDPALSSSDVHEMLAVHGILSSSQHFGGAASEKPFITIVPQNKSNESARPSRGLPLLRIENLRTFRHAFKIQTLGSWKLPILPTYDADF